MKPTTTWILIADGAHARLFANHGPGKGIEALEAINGDHRPDSELVRGGLGARSSRPATCATPSSRAPTRTAS
jgi:hypothetical protein